MAFAHQVNAGINKELLESIQIPSHESSDIGFYNKLLVEKMIKLGEGQDHDCTITITNIFVFSFFWLCL